MDFNELTRRAERMEAQMESLRAELKQLRQDLLISQSARTENGQASNSCLAVALSMAEDLGPSFSSQDPHQLTGRGDEWF